MVGERGVAVVLAEVAGDGLTIVRSKELGRGVPELAGVGGLGVVESVLELGVALGEEGVELELVANEGEVEGLARGENDDLF